MKTTILILLGFIIMITGIIEYLFLGCIVWLGLILICTVLNFFVKQHIAKNQV